MTWPRRTLFHFPSDRLSAPRSFVLCWRFYVGLDNGVRIPRDFRHSYDRSGHIRARLGPFNSPECIHCNRYGIEANRLRRQFPFPFFSQEKSNESRTRQRRKWPAPEVNRPESEPAQVAKRRAGGYPRDGLWYGRKGYNLPD